MIEEPVENASSISTKPNSLLDQSISSSQKRLRCIIISDASDTYSITKSRSLTPSSEFMLISAKPSRSATRRRLSG